MPSSVGPEPRIGKDTPEIEHKALIKELRLTEFGDSGVYFQLFFWTNDVFRVEQLKSDLRVKIFEALRANNITIPFPQRTLHIKNSEIGNKA